MKMALIESLAGNGIQIGPEPSATCAECDHRWGNHLAVTMSDVSLDGGGMLCPIVGCVCPVTWSVAVSVCL